MLALDAALQFPAAQKGRGTLLANPYGIPATGDARRAVMDLAETMTIAAAGIRKPDGGAALWSPELVTEKYGYLAELLVANPYVQDQLLGSPSRWTSVVAFAKEAVKSPYDSHSTRRHEAVAFLKAFETEAKKCAPRMAALGAAATTPDADKLICEYSQNTFARHNDQASRRRRDIV